MINLAICSKARRKHQSYAKRLLKIKSNLLRRRSRTTTFYRRETRKWKFLQHNGPVFAPKYKPLPIGVQFRYNGKSMKLRNKTEEVMTYYAKLLKHKYAAKKRFIKNFFSDWRSSKNGRSANLQQTHGYCMWDGRHEKLNKFCVEPPGLFVGRGNHPKMGRLKRRIQPEDVIINCSPDSAVPVPPSGHCWKEVQHKNHVAWLAAWTDPISGVQKYILPNQCSQIMIRNDVEKFETARKLKRCVGTIRSRYKADMYSDNPLFRQLAVAIYFIDRLALRAGNEKEEGESADTVGCCSLRCKHVRLEKRLGKQMYKVMLNFLGKDSIPYHKEIHVPKQVYINLMEFKATKRNRDRLFDLLNTTLVNQYLDSFMKGLTAKVFRTYNASVTLQNLLKRLNKNRHNDDSSKVFAYNKANREVALLCNHQRVPSRNYQRQVNRLKKKMKLKSDEIRRCRQEIRRIKTGLKNFWCDAKRIKCSAKKLKLHLLLKQFAKLRLLVTDKVENRGIALTTSKLNYIDPRITVAWCVKNRVPLDKIYSKTQREKFSWAISAANKNFVF